MNIYKWSLNEAENANSDTDINWKIGQLAGYTNGSMRFIMQRFMEYTNDLAPRPSQELEQEIGYKLNISSNLTKPYVGLRFYMLAHRNSKADDSFTIGKAKALPLYFYDEQTECHKNIMKDQLVKGGCYEILFCEDLPVASKDKKQAWLLANFYHEQHIASCPIGTILAYASYKLLPPNWAWCNGESLEKAKYEELYKIIGDVWGNSADKNLYKLPDFRGVFLRGLDPKNKFGDYFPIGKFQDSCNKTHDHKANCAIDGEHNHAFLSNKNNNGDLKNAKFVELFQTNKAVEFLDSVVFTAVWHKHQITINELDDSKEMRPVNYAINYIIKINE